MSIRPGLCLALALSALLTTPAQAQASRTVDPALRARLETLVEQLEQQRAALHIPGMALVIVQDDEILLAKGFGVSDIEASTPVTPETLFAIGSSSKAFTTALISMLVTEGRMQWNAPVTETLPFFDLNVDSDKKDAEVTLRDLVCHRTGFTRMGILWAGGKVSRDEVLRVAAGAEPWDGFRKNFHYNNVMFLAAGEAAARVAETDFDTLLRERLLEPLGMSSSNSSVVTSQQDPRLSLGYRWDSDREEYVHLPMRVLDVIAPAGAINSNVLDMAQWLRLQLADGVIDGERLISSAQMDEMHSPQMPMGGGTFYGLGWMLSEWKGRKVVEHGGNIDGFAAEVALLPSENLGFVLLTNVTATALQSSSRSMVWSAVLGDEDGDSAATGTAHSDEPAQAIDYTPYLGTFIADYAHFDEVEFTVQVNGAGKLAIDIPGQTLFELRDPDADGRWVFALTDTIVLNFERDEDGAVQSLKLAQGGATFECPRAGYDYPLEFAMADVEPLIGRYDDQALGAEVEVLMINNRLAVDVPGQMKFRLAAPDDEGIWWFRAVPGLGVEFDLSDDGPATNMTFHERGSTRECARVSGAVAQLPTPAEVAERCQFDARNKSLEALGPLRLSGSVRLAQSGVTGRFTWTVDGPDRYLIELDFGDFVQSSDAYSDGVATQRSSLSPFETLAGKSLTQARQSNPLIFFGDWSQFGDSFTVDGRDTVDDHDALRIKLAKEGLPDVNLFIDPRTGDVLRHTSKHYEASLDIELPYSVRMEDVREVHGLRIPHRVTTTDDSTGHIIITIENIQTGVDVLPGDFVLEE